jgi:energy-coupling factor transporter ATP-binding protein EcfA2
MGKVNGIIKRDPKKGDTKRDADAAPLVIDRWNDAARAFGELKLSGDQLRAFASIPGSDDEPWDVMLQTMALDETSALKLLAQRTGLDYIAEPKLSETASRFYELVDQEDARAQSVACIEHLDGVYVIATSRPMQPSVLTMLEDILDAPINVALVPRAAVASLINRGYEQRGDLVTEIVEDIPLDQDAIEQAAGAIGKSNDLLAQARQTPVIRLVNMILFEALRRNASDVHVHPMEERLAIRFRVDGMLVDAFAPPLSLASAISSRLKVMTELDIANRHSPQDGQTTVRIGQKKIDIRLSVIPTIFGERIVLRLLDQSQNELDLSAIGMSKRLQTALMDCVERPNGILLVTGPTGSGKTTTLYAALGRIDRDSRNVMTIEDPVEYHLDGISQMQVNNKRGVTFATGLRSLLRQDPDVILVGEIRDPETAQLAIQASLTALRARNAAHQRCAQRDPASAGHRGGAVPGDQLARRRARAATHASPVPDLQRHGRARRDEVRDVLRHGVQGTPCGARADADERSASTADGAARRRRDAVRGRGRRGLRADEGRRVGEGQAGADGRGGSLPRAALISPFARSP